MSTSSQPKVSILVPVYNVEKYLRQCLDSIITQTLQDIEIIVINDGSKDSSPQIIAEYAAKDARIKVINKTNSGYGHSMNVGLAAATGEYIGIVESDDWVDAEMFENLYALAKQNAAEVVKSNYYFYWSKPTEKNKLKTVLPKNDIGRVLNPQIEQGIFWCGPAIWSAIYQKDFLAQNNIKFLETPGASYQDTAFNFKVWASAKRIYLTDAAYLHYRQDNEQSSVKSPGKVYCVCDEYHEIEKFVAANNQTEQLGKLTQRLKFSTYMWNFKRLATPLKWQFLKEVREELRKIEEDGLVDKKVWGTKSYINFKMLLHCFFLFKLKYQIKCLKKKIISI